MREEVTMKRQFSLGFLIICSLMMITGASSAADKTEVAKDTLVIQGKILDSAGNALSDANILPYLNGKPFLAGRSRW